MATPRKKKGPVTAEQLMRRLRRTPAWVAEQRERERIDRAEFEDLVREEQPALRALASVGVRAKTLNDLVVRPDLRTSAIVPVILDHLRLAYNPRSKI